MRISFHVGAAVFMFVFSSALAWTPQLLTSWDGLDSEVVAGYDNLTHASACIYPPGLCTFQ